jgi:hypothetical protein
VAWGGLTGWALVHLATHPGALVLAGIWFGREQQQGKNMRVGAWDPMLDWSVWLVSAWAAWRTLS